MNIGLVEDEKNLSSLVTKYLVNEGYEVISFTTGEDAINHINEDKSDNRADNLEWCSRSYNNTYNGRAKNIGKKSAEKQRNDPNKSKPIFGIDKISGLILEFPSIREASRQTGIAQSNITRCCQGKMKSAGNHILFYVDDKEVANE